MIAKRRLEGVIMVNMLGRASPRILIDNRISDCRGV